MNKLSLTDRLYDVTTIKDGQYLLDLSFDNVLRVYELFSDEDFTVSERLYIALELLTGFNAENELNFLEVKDKLDEIFIEFLNVELFAEETEMEELSTDKEKFFDMYEDSERIYAAFMKEYGIDLFEQQGKLHFRKFNALLGQALDRDLKEVVDIRASKLPKPNKYNREEISNQLKLKKAYKLKNILDPDVAAERIDETFDKLAERFRPKGVKSDGG